MEYRTEQVQGGTRDDFVQRQVFLHLMRCLVGSKWSSGSKGEQCRHFSVLKDNSCSLFSLCCLHAVYVLTDACGFSACAAAVCSHHLPVGGRMVGKSVGRNQKGMCKQYINVCLSAPCSPCVCVTDRVIYIHSLPLPSLFLSLSYTCMSMNETQFRCFCGNCV